VQPVARRFRALVAHPHVEALGELAELLGGLGLAVETARTTVEAINKLRSQPVHVVVACALSKLRTAINHPFSASSAGQTVRLLFTTRNDSSFPTSFYFDTLALQVTYCQ
jgi:CheY-like chemotaxis protein